MTVEIEIDREFRSGKRDDGIRSRGLEVDLMTSPEYRRSKRVW